MYINKIYGFIFAIALLVFLTIGNSNPQVVVADTASKDSININLADSTQLISQTSDEFTLPPLPYDYDALSAAIDSQTMTLHHDKHHAGYIKNLNEAISLHPELKGKSIEELLQNLDTIPEDIRTTVRNNGGGHANHSLFWAVMTPNSSLEPTGEIAAAIDDRFGDFASFKEEFNAAGTKRFGSGWAWLVMDSNGELAVTSTANQDSPFIEGSYPLLGNDVWEHAYYLKYQNQRSDYLDAWWNVVNWNEVNNRLQLAKSSL